MNDAREELMLNALETEVGGVAIYQAALRCAGNEELRKEKAAELVATECVTAAETTDHHHWELIGEVAKKMKEAVHSARRARASRGSCKVNLRRGASDRSP